MTAINLVSAFIYMKGLPLQNKIQMYGIAAIFLVLLYNSPSGLVFYWTLNNIFSLVKNVFYRMRNPGLVLCALVSFVGLALLVYCLLVHPMATTKKQAFVVVAGLALQLPFLWRFFKSRFSWSLPIPEATKADSRAFVLCGLFLALLTGALIPSAVIQASPMEFASFVDYQSPLQYMSYSLAIALGTFIVWFGVFYWLMTPRGKTVFSCLMFAGAGVAVIDYMAFVPQLGNLSAALQYENTPVDSLSASAVNALVIALAGVLLAFFWLRGKRGVIAVCASMCVAVVVMSGMGVADIAHGLESLEVAATATEEYGDDGDPHVTLSRDGHNVVVIMMDRAIGYYLPYLMNENPDIAEELRGFTYYPNAVSHGNFTNVGAPGLYGGYDYTPESMNARVEQSLADKHDEALKVMPSVFLANGYEVTFFDPTYAGYKTTPDLSVFDDMPQIHTYITMNGTWDTREGFKSTSAAGLSSETMRNFFCYSLFRVSPVALQSTLYHKGDYNSTASLQGEKQVIETASKAKGLEPAFMASYSVLQNLPSMTSIGEEAGDVLFIMSNDTTHSPAVLQEPEYIPAVEVDNTVYDAEHKQRVAGDGSVITFPEESGNKESSPIMHYEVDMAAMRELCNWFGYLRENGVWDNTRIIVVSDHGRGLRLFDDLVVEANENGSQVSRDLLMANCLLMVKDFDSEEFSVDDRFMTNADTPALAMEGLIGDPVNPFTGNAINSFPKDAEERHILFTSTWDVAKNNGSTYLPSAWYAVHDDIYDRDNWEYLGYY